MSVYRIFNRLVVSTIALPCPTVQLVHPPDLTFHVYSPRDPAPINTPWHTLAGDEHNPFISYTSVKDYYIMRIFGCADFHIAPAENRIDCYPCPTIDKESLVHFFLDHAMPYTLSMTGHTVLHAGAVVTDRGAIAFSGQSGQGKSTITAAFASHGYPLLSDDSLLLEKTGSEILAIPSYPGLRLWDDTIEKLFKSEMRFDTKMTGYNQKKRIDIISDRRLKFSSDATPLKGLFVIHPSSGTNSAMDTPVSIIRLSRNKAFLELMNHTFKRLHNGYRKKVLEEFDCISRVASILPVYNLFYSRSHSTLHKLVNTISNFDI